MRGLRAVALLALATVAEGSPWSALVAKVNSLNTTWVARPPRHIADLAHAKRLCGTFLKDHPNYERLPEKLMLGIPELGALPEHFSWVEERPDCPSLKVVRDQSSCGSCWAFSSTEAFNDRRCIKYNETRLLSPEDTLSCCSGLSCGLSRGCHGGQPGAALRWMAKTGVVTGAGYETIGDGQSCRPYSMAPCAHSSPPSDKFPKCPMEYSKPQCTNTCSEKAYPTAYTADKIKGTKAYSVNGVHHIMADLYQNGPLSAAITVYGDFLTYRSGVYKQISGVHIGGHAVELVGWGTEQGVPYWLVKNSWNEQWGLNGYVKVRRGVDEVGIESMVNGIDV